MIELRLSRWDRVTGQKEIFPFDGTNFSCVDWYVPRTPERDTERLDFGYADGGNNSYSSWRNVRDSARIKFKADRVFYSIIEQLIEDAVRAQQRLTVWPKIYVEMKSSFDSDWWCSEILTGRLIPSEQVEQASETIGYFMATFEFERRFYWEQVELNSIILRDSQGIDTVSANMKNFGDALAPVRNYFDILADRFVGGTLPTPAYLTIINTTPIGPSTTIIETIRIAHNHRSSPFTYPYQLEAEVASAIGGAVPTPPTHTANWVGTNEVLAFQWAGAFPSLIPQAMITDAKSNWLRCIIATNNFNFSPIPLDALFRVEISLDGVSPVYTSAQVSRQFGEQVIDVAIAQLSNCQLTASYPLHMKLFVQYPTSAGANQLILDWMQLLPVDSYRILRVRSGILDTNETLKDNQIDDILTLEYFLPTPLPTLYEATIYYPEHGKIMLIPNKDQRIYMIAGGIFNSYSRSNTFSTSVSYRHRRLTI